MKERKKISQTKTIVITALTAIGSILGTSIANPDNYIATIFRHPYEDAISDSITLCKVNDKVDKDIFLLEISKRETSNYVIAERFAVVEGTQKKLIISNAKIEATLESILRELQKIYLSQNRINNPCDTSESVNRLVIK